MTPSRSVLLALILGLCCAGQGDAVHAAITISGDVTPGLPWNTSTVGYVGYSSSGTLTVDSSDANNDLLSRGGILGYQANATGKATITGSSSTWTSLGVYVGFEGDGTLEILDGGSVVTGLFGILGSKPGSIGSATVSGDGSIWNNGTELCVGDEGVGHLVVADHGSAVAHEVSIGRSGFGTLDVSGGGTVVAEVGKLDAGTATVSGVGSRWESTEMLSVYKGTLTVSDGANLITGEASVSDSSATAGVVTITGPESKWENAGELRVGSWGAATLNILDGAEVLSAGPVHVAVEAGSAGTIHFDNGTLATPILLAKESCLTGTGTVSVHSFCPVLADRNLVLNDPAVREFSFLLNNRPGQQITVNAKPFDSSDADLYSGYASAGALAVRNDVDVACAKGFIGHEQDAIGSITVADSGSTWQTSKELYVGYAGVGTLRVHDGGVVTTRGTTYVGYETGATGAVRVSGAGAIWNAAGVYVGYDGTGNVEVSNGGTINSVGLSLGYHGQMTSSVVVTGKGSAWNSAGGLAVGFIGAGSMTIDNGAAVTSNGGVIGQRGSLTSSMIVKGTGSTWTNSGKLRVGDDGCYSGRGVLDINNSAAVSNTDATIGYASGASGLVIVQGYSTWTNNGELCVGGHGSGTLEIGYSGLVKSQSGVVNCYDGEVSLVTVSGKNAIWDNGGDLFVSGDLDFNTPTQGTLDISNGGLVKVGGVAWIAPRQCFTGGIRFDNGTLTTHDLIASPANLNGTGVINTRGLVSDVDLVFDAAHGLRQTLVFDDLPDQSIAVDLDLSDPNDFGMLGVGLMGRGSLTIRDNVTVRSTRAWLGFVDDAVGSATVAGPNAVWDIQNALCVGGAAWGVSSGGVGSLEISKGGTVRCVSSSIGATRLSQGRVTVTGDGSKWILSSGVSVGGNGVGTLDIVNRATVNSATTSYVGSSGEGVATVDGVGSSWICGGQLHIGEYARGTLNIRNGGLVQCASAYVGVSGSRNLISVAGDGSTWNITGDLTVGYNCDSTLRITEGGIVTDKAAKIGINHGSKSRVVVSGVGSTWNNGGDLTIGDTYTSSGTKPMLHLADAGVVTATNVAIRNSLSFLSIAVDGGSKLTVGNGTGTITNNGTVRIMAGAGAAQGEYTPIAAKTFNGSGKVQTLGGTWNATSRVFTASAVEDFFVGDTAWLDLTTTQRMRIAGVDGREAVGLSFAPWDAAMLAENAAALAETVATAGGADTVILPESTVFVDASPMDAGALAGLAPYLAEGKHVRGAWDFSVLGAYTAGEPVYLSMSVGANLVQESLEVWHFDGFNWTPLDADDLTYDGTQAHFTVNGFSGYAVAGVPEPGTWALLLGLAAMVGLKRPFSRRRRRPRCQ